jgi:phosphatidylserine/phosphatidylglycerophosphate/cardiolipin synthase-like enzyme
MGSAKPLDWLEKSVPTSIVQPGRNAWRVAPARRFAVVQDAARYFRLVRRALLNARRSIFVLGWDMTAGTDLDPGAPSSDMPTRFDSVLRHAIRRQRHLHCYLLTWNYGPLFTLERDPFTRLRLSWSMPRRVHFRFDDCHPVGACHHQKIVVIDDALAFCGGIDLTGHRWDTPAHRVNEPRRVTPAGKAYGPYHEVQAMMDGPVAAHLGALARERWQQVEPIHFPAATPESDDLWPTDVAPDLVDIDVAISRTLPPYGERAGVRECEALFLDAIARARRTIYIENQYFTNERLADALAARLAAPDGPEVVLAVPRDAHGWLEHQTIGAMHDTVFRRLIAADPFRRLRIVAPIASRAADVPVFVHSKVMIVDDSFVRVGSANCTHRSMGVDTECDVAVDAAAHPGAIDGIRRIRDRLIGEHLGLSPDEVAASLVRLGSLGALVDERQWADRTLALVTLPAEPVGPPADAVRLAVDPDEPLDLGESVEQLALPRRMLGWLRRRPWLLRGTAASAVAGLLLLVRRDRNGRRQPPEVR